MKLFPQWYVSLDSQRSCVSVSQSPPPPQPYPTPYPTPNSNKPQVGRGVSITAHITMLQTPPNITHSCPQLFFLFSRTPSIYTEYCAQTAASELPARLHCETNPSALPGHLVRCSRERFVDMSDTSRETGRLGSGSTGWGPTRIKVHGCKHSEPTVGVRFTGIKGSIYDHNSVTRSAVGTPNSLTLNNGALRSRPDLGNISVPWILLCQHDHKLYRLPWPPFTRLLRVLRISVSKNALGSKFCQYNWGRSEAFYKKCLLCYQNSTR